jgi:acyl carrier protein
MTKQEITAIVINQVEQLNETFPDDQKITVNENTVLFGNGSSIDSLSLVSIIVDLETLFSDEHGYDLSLTDDRAMAREKSPFTNITTLVDYISELVNEKNK